MSKTKIAVIISPLVLCLITLYFVFREDVNWQSNSDLAHRVYADVSMAVGVSGLDVVDFAIVDGMTSDIDGLVSTLVVAVNEVGAQGNTDYSGNNIFSASGDDKKWMILQGCLADGGGGCILMIPLVRADSGMAAIVGEVKVPINVQESEIIEMRNLISDQYAKRWQ